MLMILFAACYPDISDTLDPGPDALPFEGLILDATSEEAWVGLDLDTSEIVDPEGETWDLAARRFEIKVNGGVSGDGSVEVVEADETGTPPVDGWMTDEPDADDDGIPEYALLNWYDYNFDTHVLTPVDTAWWIRTTEGQFVQLEILSYYDDAGTSARYQLATTPFGEAP